MTTVASFESFYEEFDNKTLEFNTTQFQFREWIENELKVLGLKFDKLENLHIDLDSKDCASVTKKIISETRKKSLRSIVLPFIKTNIHPLLDHTDIALQRFFNFRILLPDQPLSIIPFHNGQLQGHGLGERTIWMPLTETNETSSLYLMNIEESRRILERVREERSSYSEFQNILMKNASPANIDYGKVRLFTQENIHGSVPNETGKTRVSFDFRLLIKGLPFGRKIPGGYFSPLSSEESKL